jgi:hypothetical protein
VLLASLLVGGLAAYWFGLRSGAWAAAVTFGLCLLAAVVPELATPIYVLLAAGVAGICVLGPQRERPADTVRVTQLMRSALGQASSRWMRPNGFRKQDQGDEDKPT